MSANEAKKGKMATTIIVQNVDDLLQCKKLYFASLTWNIPGIASICIKLSITKLSFVVLKISVNPKEKNLEC